ncbi:hypothetical protein DERF_010775 [Dermatophagoides farinae]|uniref:Uncharacterized protein n=1 Tax=Dermatophagoides farinae TaxID=6954 RepID=A0A922KYJ9_DERFA|nr:hypothetical protein DERF_010775 [Dermatophagoides farinae]
MLVEVGITNKRIIPNTESTKRRKYELLANELKSMYGSKVTTVPIVLTWDGLVTRHFRNLYNKFKITICFVLHIRMFKCHITILIHCNAIQLNDIMIHIDEWKKV